MGSSPCDFEELLDLLARGTPADLAAIGRLIDGFPHGTDPVLGQRWIVHAVAAGTPATVLWMIGERVALDAANDGCPLVHRCLSREGPDRHAILAALIAAGIDVNARGGDDRTPLHLAAAEDDRAAVELLLAANADPALRSRSGATAEDEARGLGHTGVADLIASSRARG